MKKATLLLIIVIIYINCYGQTKLSRGEAKGKHDTFIIHELKTPFDSIKYLGIDSKRNKYSKGIPHSKAEKNGTILPMNFKRDLHVDNDAIKQIIYNVLNDKLNALKNGKELICVNLKFDTKGKAIDVGFLTKKDTQITLEDIEQIDQKIRKNITATFTRKEYLQYIAIYYNTPNFYF